MVVGRWCCCAVEPLDIDASAEQATNGENEKRSHGFTYLDCARACSTEIFGQGFGETANWTVDQGSAQGLWQKKTPQKAVK